MTIEVFVKKPEKVEVLKYDGTNYDEVKKFLGEQIRKVGCINTNDYIVKYNNKIIVTHDKPNFANQELLGTYNKDAVQGVNPNTHISLGKLQKCFEVPITGGVNNMINDNCGVKKYQRKPLIVEAVKNEGNNIAEIMQFTKCQCSAKVYGPDGFEYLVPTPKGTMTAKVGDYIFKDVKGKFYLCKPDEFEATYDVCE